MFVFQILCNPNYLHKATGVMNIIEYKYRFLEITSSTSAQLMYSNRLAMVVQSFATPSMKTMSVPLVTMSVPSNREG